MLCIETDRLILREFRITDWRDVHAYASDPEVVRYVEWGPNTENDTIQFVLQLLSPQRDEPRRQFVFAAVLKAEERLIGSGCCEISENDPRRGWIGYVFHRGYWGRGYATETARALVRFGFERLGLTRIIATCDARNAASARVLEKAGMRLEKTIERHKMQKGVWRDSCLYAVTDPRSDASDASDPNDTSDTSEPSDTNDTARATEGGGPPLTGNP